MSVLVHKYTVPLFVINATEITYESNTKHQNKCQYTHIHPATCSDRHVLGTTQTDAQTHSIPHTHT